MYLQQKSAYHAFKGTITEMESDISTVPERSKTEKVQYEITEKVQYESTKKYNMKLQFSTFILTIFTKSIQ